MHSCGQIVDYTIIDRTRVDIDEQATTNHSQNCKFRNNLLLKGEYS